MKGDHICTTSLSLGVTTQVNAAVMNEAGGDLRTLTQRRHEHQLLATLLRQFEREMNEAFAACNYAWPHVGYDVLVSNYHTALDELRQRITENMRTTWRIEGDDDYVGVHRGDD